MKPHVRQLLACGALALALFPFTVSAQPLHFSELSLMVRAHESEAAIRSEVARRKLAQPLTADQEAKLRAQGASEALVQAIRNSTSTTTTSSSSGTRRLPTYRASYVTPSETPGDLRFRGSRLGTSDVQIVDIGVGEPVNLSAWGGVDREFVFTRRSITDLRRTYSFYEMTNFPFYRDPSAEPTTDEVTMVDPVGSFDHFTNYQNLERGQPYLAEYASRTEHRFTRPMTIQRHNPVHIDGVPYNLYPIYAGGGVSLYYIGRISEDVVRVAVVTQRR